MQTKELIRPTWGKRTEGMTLEAGKNIAEAIMRWNSKIPYDDAIEYAMAALKYYYQNDSEFDFCKKLQEVSHGYIRPDSSLLEYIGYELLCLYQIVDKEVEKWVEENSLWLFNKTGDIVKFKTHLGFEIGEIVALYPKKYAYGIWNSQLEYEKDKGRLIVHAENIEEKLQ